MTAPPFFETDMSQRVIHCDFRSTGLAKQLSNLYPYTFTLDGIEMASMEAFLQSLKFEDESQKRLLYPMHGVQAFRAGQKGNAWKFDQLLYWNGQRIHRSSTGYQDLLERAYDALYNCSHEFRLALNQSFGCELRHDFGKVDMTDSVLTRIEYIYQLYRLRSWFTKAL